VSLRKVDIIKEKKKMEFHPLGKNMKTILPTASTLAELNAVFDKHKVDNDVCQCVTFLFKRYRTGIFSVLTQGRLHFFPFMNLETPNEYSACLKIDPYINIQKIETHVNQRFQLENKKIHYSIHRDPNEWYVTNFLVRVESYEDTNSDERKLVGFYQNELFQFLNQTVELSVELQQKSRVKPIYFVVNYKDQNLIQKNNCDPMWHIVSGYEVELKQQPFPSEQFMKICPILSFCRHTRCLDIPIPTPDDIARILPSQDTNVPMMYAESQRPQHYLPVANSPPPCFSRRLSKAVFRGSNTGAALTCDSNPRMQLAQLGKNPKYKHLLDVGLTQFVKRFKKVITEDVIKLNDTRGLNLVPRLSMAEQQHYKYQIYIEGNVAAYRLGGMLGSGSLVLLVESDYLLWFQDSKYNTESVLDPKKHYLLIAKDLSNLIPTIEYCNENKKWAQMIATKAKKFFDNNLEAQPMLQYMTRILLSL
jgi:hypothetical protein